MGTVFVSCDNDDDLNPVTDPVLDFVKYDLEERSDSGVSGEAKFNEQEDGSVQLILELDGTSSGNSHPAHIHMNTAVEGGGILYTFNPVDGTSGMSQSNVAALDDDTEFGYADVLTVDGYVNVHLSADDLATIVAQGDIGANE